MQSSSATTIYKSNALIESAYRLTLSEARILLACMAQVRRDQPITDDVLYTVTAADVANLTGTTSKATYGELKEAAIRLKRREVRLTQEPNGGGKMVKGMITGWVQTITYHDNEGKVQLRFSKDMLPYLTELTEQFTKYSLSDVAKMSSIYAIRLYELLVQQRRLGRREIEIAWLREVLVMEDQYPVLADLRRRVIDPAVKQINEMTPLQVSYTQRKAGRVITHLVFEIDEKAGVKAVPAGKKSAKGAKALSAPQGPRQGLANAPEWFTADFVRQHSAAGESFSATEARLRIQFKLAPSEEQQELSF